MSNNAQIINIGAIHVADGTTVDFVPEVDVPAASIVVVGKLVGIAKFGISAGSRGSITVRGVFDVVKDPTTNIPAGTILYWSQISWHVVKNAYAHSMIGKAIEAAPPGTLLEALINYFPESRRRLLRKAAEKQKAAESKLMIAAEKRLDDPRFQAFLDDLEKKTAAEFDRKLQTLNDSSSDLPALSESIQVL